MDDINEAVKALLQQDMFDMNFARLDDESSDGDDEDDEDSDNSDNKDDLKRMRQRIWKRAKNSRRKLALDLNDLGSDEEPASKHRMPMEIKRKVNGRDEPEIESLIKLLNAMSMNDPVYAALTAGLLIYRDCLYRNLYVIAVCDVLDCV